MRKLMMVAAAAAIALVGLSANTCGGGDQKPAEQPATQPEAQPTQPESRRRRRRRSPLSRRNSPQLTESADLGLLPLTIVGRTPPYFSASAASSTSSAWPGTFTFRQTLRITPLPSMRKVERSMPIYFLPYMLFSTHTP